MNTLKWLVDVHIKRSMHTSGKNVSICKQTYFCQRILSVRQSDFCIDAAYCWIPPHSLIFFLFPVHDNTWFNNLEIIFYDPLSVQKRMMLYHLKIKYPTHLTGFIIQLNTYLQTRKYIWGGALYFHSFYFQCNALKSILFHIFSLVQLRNNFYRNKKFKNLLLTEA